MRAIRGRDTKPELEVRRGLHRMGYRYRLHAKALPGKPDLVFPSRRKVIFVHGCFWHLHAHCSIGRIPKTRTDYWATKLNSNRKRDRQVRRKLKAMGWEALVVWECEIANLPAAIRKASEFLDVMERRRPIKNPGRDS